MIADWFLFLRRPWVWLRMSDVSMGKHVFLLVLLFVFSAMGINAQTDYKSWYPFKDNVTYYPNNGDPYILWTSVLWNDEGADEGFFSGDTYNWGLGVHIGVGNQSPSQYKYVGNLCCNENGYSRRMYNVYSKETYDTDRSWVSIPNFELGGTWTYRYSEGTDGKGKITWISPHWKIPFELRNTNIKVRLWGTWWYWNKSSSTLVDVTQTVACPYTFNVRQLNWNGEFSVSPDGTVTIPYSFGGSQNTDGRTHLCTAIDGKYEGKIGIKNISNYNNGSYTFKLSDIGKDMRSQFTIAPYHEYAHPHDRDAGNGTKYYTSSAGAKTFAQMPLATISGASYNQADNSVTLHWTADNGNYETGDWGTKWVIYRNGNKVGDVAQSVKSFTDNNVPVDQEVTYTICYVWKGWPLDTQLKELTSKPYPVSTQRKVPVNGFKAESKEDRIVFTWTSDGYPANWGNKFNIYVDDETEPIYTITPTNNQTSFRWEHRTTDKHNDRQNGVQDGIHYTEEPLNGCEPHNYRVEGVIGDKTFNSDAVQSKAIGSGTLFYDFTATKGAYPGTVKLSWHVDLQGSTTSKTYIVDRRRTEKEDEAWTTLYRTSSADEYLFYTDETPLPGIYYDYRITVQDKCDNGKIISNEATDIGFAQTTGTVSGRITFGSTGSSVAGADVIAEKSSSSGDNLEQFHSMHFTDTEQSVVTWNYPDANYAKNKFATGDYSMQMWIAPEEYPNKWMARLKGENVGAFGIFSDGRIIYCDGKKQYFFNIKLKKGAYNHVALTRKGTSVTCYLVELDSLGNPKLLKETQTIGTLDLSSATQFQLGYFKGYVDEFRLWTKCLTEDEIKENYDHLLVGNEKNLETYWTFDEGLRTQFFDYSRDGTVYNEHHGKIGSNTESSTFTPEDLALKAKTDKDGNYIIQGVPFTGEGTTYAIIPALGVHKFNPQQHLRYVGNNSLVHNGVDFDDVSSFPVSGVVYYEHTSIPVEEAYLYVDGLMASKDGEPIMTNSKGEFEISVPIGEHFIQVKKNGHTFLNDGRYPADPNGTGERVNFDRELRDVTFYDQTTVTVAGRVAGGDIEYEKPLGLNQGKNNIGKATLKLELSNENGYLNVEEPDPDDTKKTVNINKVQRDLETSYGKAYVPGSKNFITIETDSKTGEWVAQLPPLRYDVTSVAFPGRPDEDAITKDQLSLPTIDATNPNLVYTDSVEVDGVWQKFEYVGSAKMEYKAVSTIELSENKNGTFGMKNYKVKDLSGVEHVVKLYDYDDVTGNVIPNANGKVQYTFGVSNENPNGYPVYQELSSYKYTVYAYERYTNYDGDKPVVDEVPLAGKEVTIKNQYATTTSVSQADGSVGEMVDDKLELDDNGKAVYNFTVGFPNIQAPYTRGLSISYDNNGTEMEWSENGKFKVIVLGGLPTGNNFVTEGPDEVLMVLRDPPGTGSSVTWSKGTTISKTKTTTTEYTNETGINSTIYAGVKAETGVGVGFMVINELSSKVNIKAGAEYSAKRTSGNTTVQTTTTTRDISTSDAMDFVGAVGDVFIGSSKNIIFGACRSVDIKWDNVNGKAELIQEDALSMGEEFTTGFMYDQNYIKNVLIPNFVDMRNKLLTPSATTTGIPRPAVGEEPLYVTTLSEDNEKYGTSNSDKSVWGSQAVGVDKVKDGIYSGPSYTMFLPMDHELGKDYQDMVNYYNVQINKWENELRKNEEAKVTAIQNRNKWLKENHSVSAGASVTQTVSTENGTSSTSSQSDGFNIILGLELGYTFSGLGIGAELEEKNGNEWTSEEQNDTTVSVSMSYTLAEDGDDDYLSVDVFNAPDGMGPIFVTRGGATSCPYEDEVVTEYYEKGTVISAKTVQIEKPEIEAQTHTITGIPAGGSGTFKVNIRNNSDTGEDLWFDLLVTPDSNPDGLIVTMDGANLSKGNTILVKAGETMVKTLTVSQSNPDVLNYERVHLRIASQCQKDNTSTYAEIADSTEFYVYFQPSCSDIKLTASHTLVNTDTETPVTLSMSGYNYAMASLQGIRLQYKGEHDADFRTLQEYTKDAAKLASDPNLLALPALAGTAKLNYVLDLRSSSFSDKTYVFRAITVCDQGGVEVNNESEEITVIRDMTPPMLMATPSPASGILTSGDDLVITFNEDIQGSALTQPNNFDVFGVLNESEVAHDVALSVSGNSVSKTDATIDLNGKSFTTSMWVNYSTDGTLLTHGTSDYNFNVAIVDGKLAVSVAGKTVTGGDPLPKNKWLYLNVGYDAQAKTVSAGYAMDSETVSLFNSLTANAYEGNGPLSIGGNNLTAKVQELAVWNGNRSMAEAQAEMYTTKSQFTNGLIGYWQLNEGHGSVATDKARSRHMTLPSQNAWWIDGDNYALVLDGTKTAAVNIGSLNTTEKEDYLVEAWFKADKQQDGAASVLSTVKMDLRLNAQGKMELDVNGSSAEVYNKDLRDGQWHHVAVNVLKSTNGMGTVYVDGLQCKQISASAMPELFGDKLMLGGRRNQVSNGVYTFSQQMKGAIDEVRIWKGRRTADVINNNMYVRVKADEPGLVAYYPLEKLTKDAYNQIVTTGTFDNSVSKNSAAEQLSCFDADGLVLTPQLSTLSPDNTAALKQAPKFENVLFDFVASERQIKVNLKEQPAKIEGCNICITAKNVKDVNGNTCDPITWTVYVQQNKLRWQETEVEVNKVGTNAARFNATIENRGSESESWSLSGMPSWLSANVDGGSLMPLASAQLAFTVAENLPIGTYETTIYLTGSQNIAAPLNVTVVSEGQAPLWSVNPRDFEGSMNIIGQVKLDGTLMNDNKDIVAAFIGDECRGVAHLEYKDRYDGYFVTVDIFGNNASDNNKTVTFRAYDASTGTVYPAVEPDRAVKFESLALIGKYTEPVLFTVLDKIEQSTELKTGWNWMSLNVKADNMSAESILEKIADDVSIIKTQNNGWLMYEDGKWDGSLNVDLTNDQMYAVKMKNDRSLYVIGQRVNPDDCQITVNKGWNWIGYYGRQISSLDNALAGLNAVDGDMLKGQSGVAYYDASEWVGSMSLVEPGKGYMLKSVSDGARTFGYPTVAVAGARQAVSPTAHSSLSVFSPVDFRLYSGNAVMAARVVNGGKPVAHVELGVYVDDECRTAAVTNENGMAYLTIPGDDAAMLNFKVAVENEILELPYALAYEADAVYGTPKQPVLLDLNEAVGISEIMVDVDNTAVYDLSGRMVHQGKNAPRRLSKGVYILNGKKKTVK